ncbi:hypothetical protein M427DRAFT_132834 [Gonapodya prolifera JEL478]|uniref:DALR anticodon binding domain-containing protein n=1 Tax=Gonapodya prolifera (strain JEL478) TaxID=1344416 RepID=A0A139AP57_GONPJ|nr:hypothetical protein M427DRAFT_132834 [Gonapodya prolifera JEL478]|eukprot:KXS18512.1 hypothetical protein M427DRAFT_132834 [Gonapodya prolifera JEL478]
MDFYFQHVAHELLLPALRRLVESTPGDVGPKIAALVEIPPPSFTPSINLKTQTTADRNRRLPVDRNTSVITVRIAVPAVWPLVRTVKHNAGTASSSDGEGTDAGGDVFEHAARTNCGKIGRSNGAEPPWKSFADDLVAEVHADGVVVTSVNLVNVHMYFGISLSHFLRQTFLTSPAPITKQPPVPTYPVTLVLVALPDPRERRLQLKDLRTIILAAFVQSICARVQGKAVFAMEWHVRGSLRDFDGDEDDDRSRSSFSDPSLVEVRHSAKKLTSTAEDSNVSNEAYADSYRDMLSTCNLLNLRLLASPRPGTDAATSVFSSLNQESVTVQLDPAQKPDVLRLFDESHALTRFGHDLSALVGAQGEFLSRWDSSGNGETPVVSEILLVTSTRLQHHVTLLERALRSSGVSSTPPVRYVGFEDALLPPAIDIPECVLEACAIEKRDAESEVTAGFLPLRRVIDFAQRRARSTLQERWGDREENGDVFPDETQSGHASDVDALAVAVAALSAQDLTARRTKGPIWRWTACGGLFDDGVPQGALRDMERNVGVYLQYAHARLESIVSHSSLDSSLTSPSSDSLFDPSQLLPPLVSTFPQYLLALMILPSVLNGTQSNFEPVPLMSHLVHTAKLAASMAGSYRVKGMKESVKRTRGWLLEWGRRGIEGGLSGVGWTAVKRM